MRRSLKGLLLGSAAIIAWPFMAAAQDDGGFVLEEAPETEPVEITTSSVEIGAGWVSEDSFKFGEYTGLNEKGAFFVGNFESYLRPAYDNTEGDTRYFELRGTDLGLDSRSVYIETGMQGRYSVFAEYDRIPHFRLDDAQTPFLGVGGTNLTLPAGWVPGADSVDLRTTGTLTADLRGVEIETDRERVGAGFSWTMSPQWTLSTAFRVEEKDGLETIAGLFGTTGGNMRSTILPRPVDYTTRDAEMGLSYTADRFQADMRYTLSVFDDNKDSLTFANPYTAQAAWDDSQDFAAGGQGRLALEPDNSAHQISLSGGFVASPTTRITGAFSYGRMFQDDDFLPYTINTALTAADGVSTPVTLPRTSLDGDVTTLHASLGITNRPTPRTDLKAEYTFDRRDNNSPVDVYLTIPNDTGDDGGDQAAIDESRARRNTPHSQDSHKIETEAGYQVTSGTKLSLGYDFETINRDFTEVEDTYEHTGRVKIRSNLTDTTTGRLEYAYATRTGSTYVSDAAFIDSHSDAFLLTGPDTFEQNPYLRKYYMADRQRHLVKGALTTTPGDRLTLGLSGSYSLSDYDDSVLGLTESDYASGTLDAAFTPAKGVLLSGFVTYETMKNVQVGYQRRNVPIAPGDPLDDVETGGVGTGVDQGLWEETVDDRAVTAGVEAAWSLIENKVDLVLDYLYAETATEFTFATNLVGLGPLPDLTTTMHSVGLRADYTPRTDLTLRLGYRFESYEVEDFALDGVDEVIPRVLGLGNSSADYDVHLVAASVIVRF